MARFRIPLRTTLAACVAWACLGSAQALTYTEDFNATFPAWESGWFGQNSTAHNYYCYGARGCDISYGPYLWVVGTGGGSAAPVEVLFDSAFGASLTSFQMGVDAFTSSTLSAFDKDGTQIFSQELLLTSGTYATYTITSSNGISRFTLSGEAAGNVRIDDLVAITTAVPEPASAALLALGVMVTGVAATRRRRG